MLAAMLPADFPFSTNKTSNSGASCDAAFASKLLKAQKL
jgi:hypothetical protein